MGWFLKLSILSVLIHINVAVYLIPKQLVTQTGASYTIMLVDDDENIKPKQCFLNSLSDSYEIDLTTSGVPLKPINGSSRQNNTSSEEENTNIMTSLGYGICGFKLDNVGKKFVSRWNISFVDENENFYFKDTNVVLRDIKNENQTKYVTIGDSLYIQCGEDLNSRFLYLLSCLLYNPQGNLVVSGDSRTRCAHYIKTIKMSDYGTWKCMLQLENNMSPRNINYNIIERENIYTNLWQNETEMHVNIGCSIKNINSLNSSNFCEMTRPDGEIFSLKEGLATDRYTALSTNIYKGICGMEIKKPLREFEKGLWRCEFKYVNLNGKNYPTGGFINVSSETSTLPQPEIPKTILAFERNSLSITCKVPYSSSYCYMEGPNWMGNRTTYLVQDNQSPTVGLCKFTKIATMEDNGKWYCGFAQKTGEVDVLYEFQVVVHENVGVKPENEYVESTLDSTAYLKCSSQDLGDYPVQYCRFKNPSGEIYNIDTEENSTNRISYYGRGFKYGDCGIKIKNVTYSDAGVWTCITRIGNYFKYPEIYDQIDLDIY